jgi:hypothetical protein
VHVKIDKTWRQIIPGQIDYFFAVCGGFWANLRDLSVLDYELKPIPNSVRKNQPTVDENYRHNRRLQFSQLLLNDIQVWLYPCFDLGLCAVPCS